MPQPYDLTNLTSADNLAQTTKAANDLVGGLMGILFLIGVFIITSVVGSKYGSRAGFAAAIIHRV